MSNTEASLAKVRENEDNNPAQNYLRIGDLIALGTLLDPDVSYPSGRQSKYYFCSELGSKSATVKTVSVQSRESIIIMSHTYQIYDAVSVHAVDGWNGRKSQSSDKQEIVSYGQAVLLQFSKGRFVSCIPCFVNEVDQQKMDQNKTHLIGFTGSEEEVDGSCWFTIHPAEIGRIDGDKIRVGDEVYFTSVGNGRFMSPLSSTQSTTRSMKTTIEYVSPLESDSQSGINDSGISADELLDTDSIDNQVGATYTPWPWLMEMTRQGPTVKGFLHGGDPIQLKFAHCNGELLTMPLSPICTLYDPDISLQDCEMKPHFEENPVSLELRSVWMVVLMDVNYGRSLVHWEEPFRLLNMTSGLYLGVELKSFENEAGEMEEKYVLVMLEGKNADENKSIFCFMEEGRHLLNDSERNKRIPQIQLMESEVYLYHVTTQCFIGTNSKKITSTRKAPEVTAGYVTRQIAGQVTRHIITTDKPLSSNLRENIHQNKITEAVALSQKTKKYRMKVNSAYHIALSGHMCYEFKMAFESLSKILRKYGNIFQRKRRGTIYVPVGGASARMGGALEEMGPVITGSVLGQLAEEVEREEERSDDTVFIEGEDDVEMNKNRRVVIKERHLIEKKCLGKFADLLKFLQPPNPDIMDLAAYEEQKMFLKNRRTRMLNHGMVHVTFQFLKHILKHYVVYPSDNGIELQQTVCQILTYMVKSDKKSCDSFAKKELIDDMIDMLSNVHLLHPVLELMNCLLEESHLMLSSISKKQLNDIFVLLLRNGRDDKIMSLLGRLSVCKGVALREKQQWTCKHMMDSTDLFLHTTLLPKLYSLYANVFMSTMEGFGNKWYFEFHWTPPKHAEDDSNTYIRFGCTEYFSFHPYPKCKGFGTTQGGIGDDRVSVGFDGTYVWCNGGRHHHGTTPTDQHSSSSLSSTYSSSSSEGPLVYGCCVDMLNSTVRFTCNGEPIPMQVRFNFSAETILVPAVSFTGGIHDAQLCLGPGYGDLFYEPPQGYSPLSSITRTGCYNSCNLISLSPFINVGNSKERILHGPNVFANLTTFSPLTVEENTFVAIKPELQSAVNMFPRILHDINVTKLINSGYSFAPVTDHTHKVHAHLCNYTKLPTDVKNSLKRKGEILISSLVSFGCRVTLQSLTIPEIEEDEEVHDNDDGVFKPHPLELPDVFPFYLKPVAQKLADYSHNQWAKEQISKGWKYGLATRCDVKHDQYLIPYQCLPDSLKNKYTEEEKTKILILLALGCKIFPPPLKGLIDLHSCQQIPFRNFRGQKLNYCKGKGKWYFKVKIIKGKMMRVGWATDESHSNSLLGSDLFSYAIEGYQGYKWHEDRSKKFGSTWNEGDIITCLIDLDDRIMLFARNNELIRTSFGNMIAFDDLPANVSFIPAVSVFVGEQVQLMLNPDKEVNDIFGETFEAIEFGIRDSIPIWYSNNAHHYEIISSSDPELSIDRSKDSITIKSKSNHPACIRLNMGITVNLESEIEKEEREREEKEREEQKREERGKDIESETQTEDTTQIQPEREEIQPELINDDVVSFTVSIPCAENPENVYIGWAGPDFVFHSKQYKSNPEMLVMSNDIIATPWSHDQDETPQDERPQKRQFGRIPTFEYFHDPLYEDIDLEPNERPLKRGVSSREGDDIYVKGPVHHCNSYLVQVNSLLVDKNSKCLSIPTNVSCALNIKSGEMTFWSPENRRADSSLFITLQLKNSSKLYPIMITDPSQSSLGCFSFMPASGTRPLVSRLLGNYYTPECPNLVNAMKLMRAVDSRWYQMDDDYRPPLPSSNPLAILNMVSYSRPYLSLPLEGTVMKLRELIEEPSLYSYYVSSLKTLRSVCMHDNTVTARQVKGIISWSHLIQSVQTSRWCYELRSECLNLINALYLEHEVTTRLLTRQDWIYAADCSELNTSEAERKISLAQPLVERGVVSAKQCSSPRHFEQLKVLRKVVFSDMALLQSADVMTCRMLSQRDHNLLFLPILKAIDGFLVLGMLNESMNYEKLISLLHPSMSSRKDEVCNFYLLTMKSDYEIRSVLCDILDHICELHLQGRLDHIVKFASSFVEELQFEQHMRASKSLDQLPALVVQELNTPTEQQMKNFLNFQDKDCPTSQQLAQLLMTFHTQLKEHCGVASPTSSHNRYTNNNEVSEKFKNQIISSKSVHSLFTFSNASKLQKVIVETMIRWSKEKMSDFELPDKIYSIIYRQFNETERVIQALQRTYVIEHTIDLTSNDLTMFQGAIGELRQLLQLGISQVASKEENQVLKKNLRIVSESKLFNLHPDLIRLTRIHELVLALMKAYLSSEQQKKSQYEFIDSVVECCSFLCSFVQTSEQNQVVLFNAVSYLLDQCILYSDHIGNSICDPLDVAREIIANNNKLLLELTADHIYQIISCMSKMGKLSNERKQRSSRINLFTEWSPVGAKKCLDFLQTTVLIDGETIPKNASLLINAFMYHTECLGPSCANCKLQIEEIYTKCFVHVDTPTQARRRRLTRMSTFPLASHPPLLKRQQTIVRMSLSSNSSMTNMVTSMHVSNETAELTLSFYSSLIYLLATCAIRNMNNRLVYISEQVLPFLRLLVSYDTLQKLLAMPTSPTFHHYLPPSQKEILLMFFDRVYSIYTSEFFLDFLTNVLLPDITAVVQESTLSCKYDVYSFLRYIGNYVLPFISRYAHFVPKLVPAHLQVFNDLTLHVYRIIQTHCKTCVEFKNKGEEFLITMTKTLPPQSILKLLPHMLPDISKCTPAVMSAIKVITGHYQYYYQFYAYEESDNVYVLPDPSQKEVVYASVLFSWCLETLPKMGRPEREVILTCLKSLSSCLLPETLVPPHGLVTDDMNSLSYYREDVIKGHLTDKNIPELGISWVNDFSEYVHKKWVYTRLNQGWKYSRITNRLSYQDSRLKPFDTLPEKNRNVVVNQVEQLLKVLMFYGCVFNPIYMPKEIIPQLPKRTCTIEGGSEGDAHFYEPSIPDLGRVKAPLDFHAITSSTVIILESLKRKPRTRSPSLIPPSSPTPSSLSSPTIPPSPSPSQSSSQATTYDPIDELYFNKLNNNGTPELFVEDFLRFLTTKGFICKGSFAPIPGQLQDILNQTIDYEPFASQLFQIFVDQLKVQCTCTSDKCDCHAFKLSLFPIVSSYLKTNACYFSEVAEGTHYQLTMAMIEEKLQIIEMLMCCHELIEGHIDSFFPPVKVNLSLPPLPHGKLLMNMIETNTVCLRQISSLYLSLVNATDTSESEVMTKVDDYFKKVSSFFDSFPSSIERLANDTSSRRDRNIILYTLQCLIPSLTPFITLIQPEYNQCTVYWPKIFNNLYIVLKTHVEIFVENQSLESIGKCLSAMCLKFPPPPPLITDNNTDDTTNATNGTTPSSDDTTASGNTDTATNGTSTNINDTTASVYGLDEVELMKCLTISSLSRQESLKTIISTLVVAPVLSSFKLRFTVQNNLSADQSEIDKLLKVILKLIFIYQDCSDSCNWMKGLCYSTYKLAGYCSSTLYTTHLLPLFEALATRGTQLWQEEQLIENTLHVDDKMLTARQRAFTKNLKLFVQDLSCFLVFLFEFTQKNIELVLDFKDVSLFKYLSCLVTYCLGSQRFSFHLNSYDNNDSFSPFKVYVQGTQVHWNILINYTISLILKLPPSAVSILEKLGPVFDHKPPKSRAEVDETIISIFDEEYTKSLKKGYRAGLGERKTYIELNVLKLEENIDIARCLVQVKRLMKQVNKPTQARGRWKEIISRKRRQGIVKCLKSVPFYRLKKHRAINFFLQEYSTNWLMECRQSNMERLCEQLLDKEDHIQKRALSRFNLIQSEKVTDPLEQLFSMFKVQASTEQWEGVSATLYSSYATAVIKTFETLFEEEEELRDNLYENFNGLHTKVVAKQDQLIKRKVPTMLVAVVAQSNGQFCPLVHVTLKLGIIQLEGGNKTAQDAFIEEVSNPSYMSFWVSVKNLILNCRVLNFKGFEKCEAVDDGRIIERVFPDAYQVIDLFRFLQLLCEGHNLDFQNLMRRQGHDTVNPNIVSLSAKYLQRLQFSIRDFYYYHSKHEILGLAARESFLISFRVVRQVFRTITEFVQGPCVLNQKTLIDSDLWTAAYGLMDTFVNLHKKLLRHTVHVELLLEILSLQEEFFILLRALLEGCTRGSKMGETVVELLNDCGENIEELTTFYVIFIKLKDATSSKAFQEYDLNKDGFISYREFEKAMNVQQHYTKQEIDYLMRLADTNKDGLLDYQEFTERFHQPTHNLGFHLCALIQQLVDIIPEDLRLIKLVDKVCDLSAHFEKNLGCVEVKGKSGNIERVYFHIKSSHIAQWEGKAIKQSKNTFLYNCEWSSQREKLEGFIDFCEDTVYQMTYNDEILEVEQKEKEEKAVTLRSTNYPSSTNNRNFLNKTFNNLSTLRTANPSHPAVKVANVFWFVWTTLIMGFILPPIVKVSNKAGSVISNMWYKEDKPLTNNFSIWKRFKTPPLPDYIPKMVFSVSVKGHFAGNYFTIKYLLLVITFFINLCILFTTKTYEVPEDSIDHYLISILHWLIYSHNVLSCMKMISFWFLKFPLIIFRKEKQTVRRIERKLLQKRFYETPSLSIMDRLVIKSSSFPRRFWDKQIKERILDGCAVEYRSVISKELGKAPKSKSENISSMKEKAKWFIGNIIDVRYQLWCLITMLKDFNCIYHVGYCIVSLAGMKYNNFLFSILLLDLMFQSRTLITVLRAVIINKKQLVMTLGLTIVITYIYATLAYMFFQKYYILEDPDGQGLRRHCDSMLGCFLFHMDKGLRSGGGIADAILSAFTDNNYHVRLIFDMTFFFVIIVILLAIIQGLIIDAFGELRKKSDTVAEELKTKCFICGMYITEFVNPNQFDEHTKRHHSMRDYMFFLMHLIRKPVTEFTGQESHVWELYLQQNLDFFPAGECFYKENRPSAFPAPTAATN